MAYEHRTVEPKWQARWREAGLHKTTVRPGQAEVLRARHVPVPVGRGPARRPPEGYTATDIIARYKRMRGFNVLHPMGWDAFGLPAEQLRDQDRHAPARHDRAQHRQLPRGSSKRSASPTTGTREVDTTDPGYYSWTQWIFLQLFERGLAYEGERPGQLVPGARHRARQRRGQSTARASVGGYPVDAQGRCASGCCGSPRTPTACSRTSTSSTGPSRRWRCSATGSAAARAPRSTFATSTAGRRARAARVHHAARHAVRRDVHGARARAPAGRRADHARRSARRSTAYREQARAQERPRAHRPRQGQDRRVHRRVRRSTRSTASRSRSGSPTTCSAATAPARSWPCPAHDERDFEFAQQVRPARSSQVVQPADGTRDRRRRGVHRRRRRRQLRAASTACRRAEAKTQIIAELEARGVGKRRGQLQAARLGVLAPALLGRADPDRPLRRRTASVPVPEAELPVRLPDVERYKPTGTRRVAARGDRELGRTRPARRAAGRRGARRTPCRSGRARAGTTCASSIRRTTTQLVDPRAREALDAGRPLRRRRRARGAAPAVRALLAQGALRHRRGAPPEPFKKLRHQGTVLAYSYQDAMGRYHELAEVELARRGGASLKATGEKLKQSASRRWPRRR